MAIVREETSSLMKPMTESYKCCVVGRVLRIVTEAFTSLSTYGISAYRTKMCHDNDVAK